MPNNYSWNKNHNVLYIDNPVGAGYSFTDSENGYATSADNVGHNLLVALQQFFVMFPELQKNAFFVSGHSYGGKYATAIGYAIYQDNKRRTVDPTKPKINLNGLLIESGWIDPIHQINYADYFYKLKLIDSNGKRLIQEKQDESIDCIRRSEFECALDAFIEIHNNFALNANQTAYDTDPAIQTFLLKSQTRHAIHVGNNTFYDAAEVWDHFKNDFMDSVANWVAELLSHYGILFFHGELDVVCPHPLAVNYWKNLSFVGAEQYLNAESHSWFVDNELAGYVKQAGKLTEILVRNAGKFLLFCPIIFLNVF